MIEYFEALEAEEQKNVKETIQLLLKQTFLLERKYDRRLGRMQFHRSYRVCYKHFAFIRAYFAVAGIELLENSQAGVIYIRGEQVLGEKVSKLTTIYILMLKLLYDEQMSTASNSEQICVTLSEMNERIGNYGLLKTKPTITEIRKTVSVLRRYQLIDLFEAMEELEPDSRILIYPSIHLVLYGEDVKAFLGDIREESKEDHQERIPDGIDADEEIEE